MALYMQSLRKIDPAQRAAIDSFTNPQGVTAYNNGGQGAQTAPNPGGSFGMALSNTMGLNKKSGGEWNPQNHFPGFDGPPGGKGGR
jgi:hypothetical protein